MKKKIIAKTGSIDQMLSEFQTRIDELDSGVETSTNIQSSSGWDTHYVLEDSYGAPQAGVDRKVFDTFDELQDYILENPDVEERVNEGYATYYEEPADTYDGYSDIDDCTEIDSCDQADIDESTNIEASDTSQEFIQDELDRAYGALDDLDAYIAHLKDNTGGQLNKLASKADSQATRIRSTLDQFYDTFTNLQQ